MTGAAVSGPPDEVASRLEEHARQSEARFSAILEQLPGAIGLFDKSGHTRFCGGMLSGYWPDVMPSLDPRVHNRWRAQGAQGRLAPSEFPAARALRGETVIPGTDYLYTAEDGREAWIRVSASPFRSAAGEVVGAVAIFVDVDDVKRVEERLRRSEARLQAAIDMVGLGLYAWNPGTRELQGDDTALSFWGLPPGAEVNGDVWREGIHPDDRERVLAAVERSRAPGSDGKFDLEYRVIGKMDGIERWVATRGKLNFENGEPTWFYGVIQDVTAKKRVEETLERRVEERTRELRESNRQLRAQIEQREAAEAQVRQLQRLDAIGQITAGVAHDFNNLLSVILINARLLARTPRDSREQESVDLIRMAGERGANLTAQLLAFSRKQRLEPEDIDLNRRILDVLDLVGATLGGTVKLRTELAEDLWTARVDPTQIELIVLNLAINARDAMKPGGILTIETCNAVVEDQPLGPGEPVPGRYVCLAVRDTGTGMSQDVLAHAFEPFFTTKPPGKGSGLGLPQVYGVAKQSGGGVRIESKPGLGTCVKVFLPTGEFAWEREEQAPHPPQADRAEKPTRVLVVDDDEAVLRSTVRMLEARGCEAISAGSGEEAIRMIAADDNIDVVVADYAMPEMTGIELGDELARQYSALPVLLVTGYDHDLGLADSAEVEIVQKPFSEDVIMESIAAALAKARK
jgi:PAS domain S-box-containing protein